MDIVREKISKDELKKHAEATFGDFVKAVVDIERGIMAIGGELHADEETLLLKDGSTGKNLWGINLYPEETGEGWLEFNSMINIRPSQNNRTRGVEDRNIQEQIRAVVNKIVQ